MKVVSGVLLAALFTVPIFAQKTTNERLQAATNTLNAMANASDKGIPKDLLSKAECVVVIPNLKKGGFIVGGQYGKGFFSCRRSGGTWSAPGALRISGGKYGLLIGGAETDVLMLVMNENGLQHLISNKFQMGGEASVAAGPIGRESSAMTDAGMHAEILTYSRSRGIFGGVDVGGATVTEDDDSNRDLYGRKISNKEILNGKLAVPSEAQNFVSTLQALASR